MGIGDDLFGVDALIEAAARTVKVASAKRHGVSPYVPHTPHPKQAEFLACNDLEAMFGGAAGGGKSDALLMAALQYVHVPGYNAIIFRRTYQDLALPGAIMSRAAEWLSGTDAKWSSQDKKWTFPSGATLSFGYLDVERDKFRYQSAEFQFVGFDELTQFPEAPYLYLFSRLRKKVGVDIPLRMRSATNPGGLGHRWVKIRFVDKLTAQARFFPSSLVDNPTADAESYREALAKLDEVTRKQLEDGIWEVDASRLVYKFDRERNLIDIIPNCAYWILSQDFGVTNATSWTIMGWNPFDPKVYIKRSWKKSDVSPSDNAQEVERLNENHHFIHLVGDTGGLGKGFTKEAISRYGLPFEAAEKQNKLGFIKYMNGAFESRQILVARTGCEDLIDEYESLVWEDDQMLAEAPGYPNHCTDGSLYGWRRCRSYLTMNGREGTQTLATRMTKW